jgi:hypothetical protein
MKKQRTGLSPIVESLIFLAAAGLALWWLLN